MKKFLAVAAACAVAFVGSAGAVVAQDGGGDPAANTNNVIAETFTTMGFDPATLASNFIGTMAPIYVSLLIFGFALATGWMVFRHYRRSASKG